MNTLAAPIRKTVAEYLERGGLSIRQIERLTGVHRDTIMRQKHEMTFANLRDDGKCRSTAQKRRLAAWGKEIPEGMRLGWNCAVPYCSNPKHFTLCVNLNYGQTEYTEIRRKLAALKEGEYFDLPEQPTDERSVLKFRTGLASNNPAHIRFIVRTIPDGGLRIIRDEDWEFNKPYRRDKKEVRAKYRVLVERMNVWLNCVICSEPFLVPACQMNGRQYCSQKCSGAGKSSEAWKRPRERGQYAGGFYLGLLWNSGDSSVRNLRKPCSVKGCAFPRIAYAKTCRYHQHFDDPKMQHGYCGLKLDLRDLMPSNNDPWPMFTTGKLWEDQYNYQRVRILRNGVYDQSEKKSDEWWRANVEQAMGILRKATGKEPPRPGELTPTAPTGPQMSLRGKMRNHSKKKVRKAQRQRPAGWHGSRPDHDVVKRWNREAVELEPAMLSPKRNRIEIAIEEPEVDEIELEFQEREYLAEEISDDMETFDIAEHFSWESA